MSRLLRASILSFAVAAVPVGYSLAHEPDAKPAEEVAVHGRRPTVQIALLLDTSNSMDGLIFQARTQLWTIVNEFARSKRDGVRPRLEVALYEYGNDRLSPGEGYVRLVCNFTDDLDALSEKLWQLTTNGGTEMCGEVIHQSLEGLAWDNDPRTYKAIFVAGNEPFTQGERDYKRSCAAAIGKGVVVNTIHCGTRDDGINGMWADGAKRGEGEFMWIDQNHQRRHIVCPQDDEIAKLSQELNGTYVAYGRDGVAAAQRQVAQDRLASDNAAAGAEVARANAKAGGMYRNAGWDLVDAVKEGKVKLEEVKDADLPGAMQSMNAEQRQQYVTEQQQRRSEIAAKIQQLNDERGKFLAEAEKTEAADGKETLDTAAVKTVREQLKAKGYEVEK